MDLANNFFLLGFEKFTLMDPLKKHALMENIFII